MSHQQHQSSAPWTWFCLLPPGTTYGNYASKHRHPGRMPTCDNHPPRYSELLCGMVPIMDYHSLIVKPIWYFYGLLTPNVVY